jgi:signal transduction histidine kinase
MTLTADEQYVELVVQDDGCGFDPDAVAQTSGSVHFGLTGMAERVKLLGGSICIESTPGAGTCIDVSVPYKEKGA